MTIGLLGRKLGMSQLFDTDGNIVPVTLIQAGPCPVVHKRTADRDGYDALQLGFGRKKQANRPALGQVKAAGIEPPRHLREFRTDGPTEYEVGALLHVDMFAVGEKVDVTGWSKGRGFSGPIRRHHSSRGPETHGSKYHRRPGSMSQSAWPSHVFMGMKAAGQLGAARATVQNLEVVGADKDRNLLIVKGAVPGHTNGFVIIRKAVRVKAKKQKRG
jgi:large subunit ribosomal protein L3